MDARLIDLAPPGDDTSATGFRACPCGCGEYLLTYANCTERRAALAEQNARLRQLRRAAPGPMATPWGPVTDYHRDRHAPGYEHQPMFYLGSHRPHWLTFPPVPLFISANTLRRYRSTGDEWPTRKADSFGCGSWALDSGGFTELRDHGEWRQHPDEYGGMVTRFMEEIGAPPAFVSPQDWMCEPWVISGGVRQGQRFAGTGLTVRDHLEWTVENYCYLREEFYFVPWVPVLQGWRLDDYELCYQMYADAGVDLAAEPLVGLGSVCRRQATSEIEAIVETFWRRGLRLHGFGVKIDGFGRYGHMLESADSMAWSIRARLENIRLPGCEHTGPCNNCPRYALAWREQVLAALRAPRQLDLFDDLWRAGPWAELLASI